MQIRINDRPIGPGHPPYVIAELSANHDGDLDTALSLIDMAKARGADAVKIQTYRPDTITLDASTPDFVIEGGLWHGRRLYDLYAEAHTPWEWHPALFERARAQGITLFSSPFDATAVDLLEGLRAPAYKVASFEVVDTPLIRRIAATGKPMIISTGMADADEIGDAVAAARDGGCRELVLLHCVSGYPAPAADYNLATLSDMARRFGVPVGLSDHTLDNATAVAAVALGACVIEKHVTLDRAGGGPDDSFSLEPVELETLCRDARTAWEAIGRGRLRAQDVRAGQRAVPPLPLLRARPSGGGDRAPGRGPQRATGARPAARPAGRRDRRPPRPRRPSGDPGPRGRSRNDRGREGGAEPARSAPRRIGRRSGSRADGRGAPAGASRRGPVARRLGDRRQPRLRRVARGPARSPRRRRLCGRHGHGIGTVPRDRGERDGPWAAAVRSSRCARRGSRSTERPRTTCASSSSSRGSAVRSARRYSAPTTGMRRASWGRRDWRSPPPPGP